MPVALAAKWILGLAALAGLAWLLSAPQPSRAPLPGRTPVRFWHMWTGEWKDVIDKIADRFNQSQSEFDVQALSVPTQGADVKLLLAAAGGDPPDVMAQWNPVIPTWANNGLLTPLDSLMTPEEHSRFEQEAYPVVKRLGEYKGHLYGLTIGLNIHACYYRPDHFREAGLDPDHFPTTMEELVAVGEKLNRFDKAHNLTRIGFMPKDFRHMAPIFGGGFYDWDRGELTIKTEQNLRALTFLADERRKLGFSNVVRFESGLNTGGFSVEWPFISGAYSVLIDGQWRVEQVGKFAPNLEYRVAPIPPPKGGRKLSGWSNGNFLVIPKAAHHRDGAWEFVKFWSGLEQPERAAEFYTMGGWLPLSPAVANAPKYQEYLRKYPQFRTFLEILPSENIQPLPPVPYQVFLMDGIKRAEEAATRGTLTPEQALDKLDRDLAHERARRKEIGYEE
jgi:multiple sugar transport system substrate-binding protein